MKKIISLILVAFLLVSSIMIFSSCGETSRLKKELCSYDFQVQSKYTTAESCFDALLELNTIQDENSTAIIRRLSLDDDEEKELKAYNDKKFAELAAQILNNTTAKLEFSHSEIIETFSGHNGYLIRCVGENYDELEYKSAFSSFLYFFRSDAKYKNDCIYYVCNTLYPKMFNQGIIDTFLSIGVSTWGDLGAETLEETISYVSSSPEGITPYEDYIATAREQLSEKNAIEDSKPKHYCVECGSKANWSYKSPFSGQTEWYCYSCYQELQDLLDQFGMN